MTENRFYVQWEKEAYKDLIKLDATIALQILNSIAKLAHNPKEIGKPLKGNLKHKMRLRVGDYRVVYEIEENKVLLTDIGHRKDIYEGD